MTRWFLLLMVLLAGAAGCGKKKAETSGQSFADGMKALCNPEIDKAAPASERQMKMASWIKDNVSNPEVIQLFQSMGELPPAEREAAMDQAIAKAGLTSCPIAGE
jgi:predicted small lipoprotein YifL